MKVLHELLAELKHRSTPKAYALRKDVEEALGQARGFGTSGTRSGQTVPPPPASQTMTCRSCSIVLRVPIQTERTAYTCPTCKAEFETVFRDGVLQVVWVEKKASSEQTNDVMTDALAREILDVAAETPFPIIKAAWRKASQQYHPDKHQALPERLRRAAELEMKRINEAYRFLEASTASDF